MSRLEKWLRSLSRKGHIAREVVRSRGAVLSLRNSVGVQLYWHIGYSNLKCIAFVLLALERVPADRGLPPPLPETQLLQRKAAESRAVGF